MNLEWLAWPAISAIGTAVTGVFTVLLVVSTVLLWLATKSSVRVAQAAADAAHRSADAAVTSSTPVVFPEILAMDGLLPRPPVPADASHEPVLFFRLRNHGNTPGIVRSVRFELQLLSALPPAPPYAAPTWRRTSEVIPGQTAGPANIQVRGTGICSQEIERTQLRLEDPRSMRFHFFGEIIYDDFFGYQHVQGFYFKVTRHGWHSVVGGDAYNYKRRLPAAAVPVPDAEEY
jgi:hypothetical protein